MIDLHVVLDDGAAVIFDNAGRTVDLCVERVAKIGTTGVVARNETPPTYYPPHRIVEIKFIERKGDEA